MRAKQMWFNWTYHGLPRCDAYYAMSQRSFCGRLIYPWQHRVGPESLAHAGCRSRERQELDEHERVFG